MFYVFFYLFEDDQSANNIEPFCVFFFILKLNNNSNKVKG